MNWMTTIQTRLQAGEKPTYDELEEALAGALIERAKYKNAMEDLAAWLGTMSAALIEGDANKLAATVSAFVQQRVHVAGTHAAGKKRKTND